MKNVILKIVIITIVSSPAKGDGLINGSFETPEAGTGLVSITPGNEPAGFGWTVLSGDIEVNSENISGLPGPSFEGDQKIDLNGSSPSGITQVFATVVGRNYSLRFAYASNYVHHGPSNPALATCSVADAGSSSNLITPQVISHGSSTSTNLDWKVQTVHFVAASASTRISFVSNSLETPFGGILLDGVSVSAAPEAARFTIAMYAGLTIQGGLGQTYGIQASSDLGNSSGWVGVANVTLVQSPQIWYDSKSTAQQPKRFYRVVAGPIPIP